MRKFITIFIVLLFQTALSYSQVSVSPDNVNAYSQGATTVYLTFGNVVNVRPAEAFWCGEIIPATPDIGFKCSPNSIFGQLPTRYDQSRLSGNNSYTDIMSITPAVARRAYLDAVSGNNSTFFYVRRFLGLNGGQDQYVPVRIRLSGNGAGVSFSLTGVRLLWQNGEKVVPFIKPNENLPAITAEIRYTGTGTLKGRWEIVKPGEVLPESRDLLSEAALPPEERGTQRRYTELSRFNVSLPPGGKYLLEGPKNWRIDKTIEGMYLLLLRIEVSDSANSVSDLAAVNAGNRKISTGAVAGFPMPTLRYYVGNNETALNNLQNSPKELEVSQKTIIVRWKPQENVRFYRLEVREESEEEIFQAIVLGNRLEYVLPSFVQELARSKVLKWRVVAVEKEGKILSEGSFQTLEFE